MDVNRWQKGNESLNGKIANLLFSYREFRNLFIYRNNTHIIFSRWIKLWYPPEKTLYIVSPDIGGGFYIQHGFATYISAEKIGENCWVNQQVTIGFKDDSGKSPVIGDNVTVSCGAKVLGNIILGNKMVIGANAVVTKSFPQGNCIIAGVPAKEIRRYQSHPENKKVENLND